MIGGSLEDLDKGLPDDRAFLAEAHHNAIPLIGIGTGSFILAEEGISMNGAPRSILIIMTSSRNGFRRFMPSRGWILSMKAMC